MTLPALEPVWTPTDRQVRETNIASLMLRLGIADYPAFHRFSVTHREEFWRMVIGALGIRFTRPPQRVLGQPCDPKRPRWLPGARMNIADSCFSPLTPCDKPAIIWGTCGPPGGIGGTGDTAGASGGSGGSSTMVSYRDLQTLVNRVAFSLARLGVKPGERIAMVMPMTPQSVAIYLGIIRAGCVVVCIAESFAPPEIAARLRIAGCSMVFTQDVTHRMDKVLPLYEKVAAAGAAKVVVVPASETTAVSPRPGDLTWANFLAEAGEFEPVACDPDGHTSILFSSGTTGEPKAIPWTHTTPIKCAADAFLHHDVHPGDVLAWPTSMGWMMGPWLIYASLINSATLALYEDAPQTRGFAEFASRAGVTMLGVVPSLVSHWRANKTLDGVDLGRIRRYSSTGECSNRDDMRWLMTLTPEPRPIIEYCGGTEIGGGYVTSTMLQPNTPSAFTTPALGLDIVLLDEQGNPTDNGEAFLVPPSIGLSTELLNRDHDEIYFSSGWTHAGAPLRSHGDQLQRSPAGDYRALGRADDTMNLGGIKVSSAEIERVLSGLPGIKETAAIAVSPSNGGPSRLVIFAVGDRPPAELKPAMQQAIRESLNPLFHVHDVVVLDALPRTASNKVMRRELREKHSQSREA